MRCALRIIAGSNRVAERPEAPGHIYFHFYVDKSTPSPTVRCRVVAGPVSLAATAWEGPRQLGWPARSDGVRRPLILPLPDEISCLRFSPGWITMALLVGFGRRTRPRKGCFLLDCNELQDPLASPATCGFAMP